LEINGRRRTGRGLLWRSRRFYLTLRGFAAAAAKQARQDEIILCDALGIRDWTLDIEQRERTVIRITRA
jgi:hypothetical protein